MKKKFTIWTLLLYLVLIVYTVFLFFPIATVLVTSFVPTEELATSTGFVWGSANATLEAYKAIFLNDSYINIVGMPGLLLGFLNTMWLTLVPLCVGLMMAGLSA